MIKKIPSSKLRIGMFVDHIDRGWLENPFFKDSFKIVTESQIEKFFEYGIREVYIDTSRGLDFLEDTGLRDKETYDSFSDTSARAESSAPLNVEKQDLDALESFRQAERVYEKSFQTTRKLMNDVRLGRLVDVKEVTETVENLVEQILDNQEAVVGLSKLQDYDDYTYTHSLNVCIFCLSIGKALGYSKDRLSVLGVGALTHDFGKMLVPKKILNKPGRLTPAEFKIMQEHVVRGVDYLKQLSGIMPEAIQVAFEHHERHSGKGYPRGLKGEEISEFGKIAAVVDVYDAITSDRVYHRGMIPSKALRKIYEWRYHDFDPELVEMFIKIVGIYPLGSLVRLSDDSIGMVIEGNQTNSVRPKLLVIYDGKGNLLPEPKKLDLSSVLSMRILGTLNPEEIEIDIKKTWDKYLL